MSVIFKNYTHFLAVGYNSFVTSQPSSCKQTRARSYFLLFTNESKRT